MKFIPVLDRILLDIDKPEEETKSGIIIPVKHQNVQQTAIVLAVGPGKPNKDGVLMPMSVKVGDRIIFVKHCSIEIKIDDKEYGYITNDDIVGILK
ncbi:hypothetical protein LCGC14_2367420 [marine sediment metagenome]|uniref:10 kDa chaperonin n=1 Tax=marine sediment metagenome TaxID=412755 RepID=A0A0F9EHB8_9ZZZZ